MLVNLVLAPLIWPPLTAVMIADLYRFGLPRPDTLAALVESTLWMSVAAFGVGSVLWISLIGMRRRRLMGLWLFLPLLAPYYLLMSAESWAALFDLMLKPFHWHKTEHGLARRSRQSETKSKAIARAEAGPIEISGGRAGARA